MALKGDEFAKWLQDRLETQKYAPGDDISEDMLMRDYREYTNRADFSRMPVRKAVCALEAAGIFSVTPKKGTKVKVLTPSEIQQIWTSWVSLSESALVQLAMNPHPDLSAAEKAMKSTEMLLSKSKNLYFLTADHVREFIALDKAFHSELCTAAGLHAIGEEISQMRLKLQIAARVENRKTHRQIMEVFAANRDILDSLRNSSSAGWLLPDINSVRLAFRVYARNAGRQWWGMEPLRKLDASSGGFPHNDVFAVPATPQKILSEKMIKDLWNMRQSMELLATRIVASSPASSDVGSSLAELNLEMQRIAELSSGDSRVCAQDLASFDNLDICFHTTICSAAGILFGEDALLYAWRHLRIATNEDDARRSDLDRVLLEHSKIVDAIRQSDGREPAVDRAVQTVFDHFLRILERKISRAESDISRKTFTLLHDSLAGSLETVTGNDAASAAFSGPLNI